MMEAGRQWLPQFGGRRPRPTPAVPTAPDAQRVSVPADPALAIANRFGELAAKKMS